MTFKAYLLTLAEPIHTAHEGTRHFLYSSLMSSSKSVSRKRSHDSHSRQNGTARRLNRRNATNLQCNIQLSAWVRHSVSENAKQNEMNTGKKEEEEQKHTLS